MYYTSIEEIKYPELHDAVLLASVLMKNRCNSQLKSVYMDPNGECAITFSGKLSDDDIEQIKLQFTSPYADEITVSDEDYEYIPKENVTRYYTPDGFDCRIKHW